MAFMMKKKKYKFTVELFLEEITAVPFLNGVLFAKVRLLDGGFMYTSSREEVRDHKVRWGAKFEFVCKMSANASTGVLDPRILRVSVRKELKGGRSFQKLGFTDLNLVEFAATGPTQRKCLLEGYDTRRRLDNSTLSISITMNMLAGDILFKVPSPTVKPKPISGEEPETVATVEGGDDAERREDFSGGSIASASSGFSSLTKKRPPLFNSDVPGETEESTVPSADPYSCATVVTTVPIQPPQLDEGLEMGHSRNPSTTSQLSKGSGYGSMNSQHSRQSSSGDSGHIRSPSWPVWSPRLEPVPGSPKSWASPLLLRYKPEGRPLATPQHQAANHVHQRSNNASQTPTPSVVSPFKFPPWSTPRATSSPGLLSPPSPPHLLNATPTSSLTAKDCTASSTGHERSLRKVSESCKLSLVSGEDVYEMPLNFTRAINNGCSGLVETGSLDRGKAALERRKKAAEEGPGSGRVEFTRINPNSVIEQLIKSTNLETEDDSVETTGLQLYIAKDGTTALGSQEVKNKVSTGVFKQVVIEENR